ncbi:MAG: hypothetical protein IPL84_14090 [Chitinophagaceae bacterium]|nr:hypothetical protein [Chitinophagaceae bacterium]
MKVKEIIIYFLIPVIIFSTPGCSAKTEQVPAAPANAKAVQDFINGKKLAVKQIGFFGLITVNGTKDVEWLDLAKEKDEITTKAAGEEMGLVLQFINDTAVTIVKKGKQYTGTYTIDDKAGEAENEQPGIKLKISYADPDFGFGGTPMDVTYTYPVIGLDAKRIMLETPRTINRQKLITIMAEL